MLGLPVHVRKHARTSWISTLSSRRWLGLIHSLRSHKYKVFGCFDISVVHTEWNGWTNILKRVYHPVHRKDVIFMNGGSRWESPSHHLILCNDLCGICFFISFQLIDQMMQQLDEALLVLHTRISKSELSNMDKNSPWRTVYPANWQDVGANSAQDF